MGVLIKSNHEKVMFDVGDIENIKMEVGQIDTDTIPGISHDEGGCGVPEDSWPKQKQKQKKKEMITDEDWEEPDPTGESALPLSKIKKIFKMDSDHKGVSAASVFTAAIATELFVQYLTEQAGLMAKSNKRKTITFKDYSDSISKVPRLNFLSNVVQQSQPSKDKINSAKRGHKKDHENTVILDKNQSTLPFNKAQKQKETTELENNINTDKQRAKYMDETADNPDIDVYSNNDDNDIDMDI